MLYTSVGQGIVWLWVNHFSFLSLGLLTCQMQLIETVVHSAFVAGDEGRLKYTHDTCPPASTGETRLRLGTGWVKWKVLPGVL